jgi:hypothetical protein
MAIKFALRSTALDAWYATGLNTHQNILGSAAIINSGATGVFGGKLIDFSGNSMNTTMAFMGGPNWASGVAGFTILMRLVPNWTGIPSVTQGLFSIGDPSNTFCEGVGVSVDQAGTISLHCRNGDTSTNYSDQLYPSPTAFPAFISGQPVDVWFRWSGLSGGQFEMWAAAAGQVPTKLTNASNGAYQAGAIRGLVCALAFRLGVNFTFDEWQSNFAINEFVIWDSFEDPTSYGARSDFISAANLEGYSYSDPGAINVAAGISYTFAGVTEVGTLGSITNEYVTPTLVVTGQSLNATLEET